MKPDKLSQLNKYIQQAMDSLNVLTPLQCDEIVREIWYIPERDEFQAAVARLWGAISAFKKGGEHGGNIEATMTIELLSPDLSNHLLLDQYLEAAVRVYQKHQQHEDDHSGDKSNLANSNFLSLGISLGGAV